MRTQHASRSSRSAVRSPTPDICWYHRRFKEHAKRRSTSCTWQQGNAESSRCGGQQLQQIHQPPLCERSAQQDELPGRHRRRSVCLSPLPSARTPDSFQLLVVCSYRHYRPYIWVHYSASGFLPTAGVFMTICRRGRDRTNHRFRLPIFYNLLVDIRHRRLIDITTLTVNVDQVGTFGGAKLKSSLAAHATTPRFWTSQK